VKGEKKVRRPGANGSRPSAGIAKPPRAAIAGGKPAQQKNTIQTKVFAWYDGKSPIFKFALKFGALMLLFYALTVTPFCERVLWPANLQANAWVSNWILQCLNQHTIVAGDTIRTEKYAFVIKRGCDATEPVWLLMAAVISFPAPFRRKLIGILVGTLLLLGINQLRVVALFFMGRDHPGLYDTLHLTVFPAVFIILAMILWVGWVEWVVGHE
jgi:exosortase/archaeosortase family protein